MFLEKGGRNKKKCFDKRKTSKIQTFSADRNLFSDTLVSGKAQSFFRVFETLKRGEYKNDSKKSRRGKKLFWLQELKTF